RCLDCGDPRRARGVRGVEGGGDPERHGEHRAHAVNDVVAEDERDAETRLFDGDPLDATRELHAGNAEEGADLGFAHKLLAGWIDGRAGLSPGGWCLSDLAELLLERHEGEDRVGDSVGAWPRGLGVCDGRRTGQRGGGEAEGVGGHACMMPKSQAYARASAM